MLGNRSFAAYTAQARGLADNYYEHLRELTPVDARVPRAYALVLVRQNRHREAAQAIQEAIRLSGSDLMSWKLSIWLCVLTRDYDEALENLEKVCRRMPTEGATGDTERKCRDFASFVGQMLGYMSGPGRVAGAQARVGSYEQSILGSLSEDRRAAAEALWQELLQDHEENVKQLGELRQHANRSAADVRSAELASLAQNDEYHVEELKRIEDLRLAHHTLASDERITAAASRVRVGGGSSSFDQTTYRGSREFGPLYRVAPGSDANAEPELDHLADRYDGLDRDRGSVGGFCTEQGLTDDQFADISAREAQADRHFDRREKLLMLRARRAAEQRRELMTSPIIGVSSELMAAMEQAKALPTYVPLPVSPD